MWYVAARDRDVATEQIQNLKTLANSTFALEGISWQTFPVRPPSGGNWPRQSICISRACRWDAIGAWHSEIAESYRRLGDVQGNPNTPNLGDEADALRSYESALTLLRTAPVSRFQRRRDLTVALVKTHASIADVLAAQRWFQVREHTLRHRVGTGERAPPIALLTNWRIGSLLQGFIVRLATSSRHRATWAGAVAEFEKALALDLANTRQSADNPEHRRLMALSHLRIAGAARCRRVAGGAGRAFAGGRDLSELGRARTRRRGPSTRSRIRAGAPGRAARGGGEQGGARRDHTGRGGSSSAGRGGILPTFAFDVT